MAVVLIVIAPERFRDEELFVTREELERAGHRTVIASSVKGVCPGSRGGFAEASLTLSEVCIDDFDAVVFVGGGGSKVYFNNANALNIASGMAARGKVVAAICLAPVILANAGVLRGKNATVAGTEAHTIELQGAVYTGPGVTVDGNVVTCNAPKGSSRFALAVIERLKASG